MSQFNMAHRVSVTLTLCLLLNLSIVSVQPARILSISFFSSRSHKNVYEPLLIALGERGHSVTIVTPVASSRNYTNVREVIGIPYEEIMDNPGLQSNAFQMKEDKIRPNPFTTTVPIFQNLCPKFLCLPQVAAVLAETFDVLLIDAFMNECILGVVPHLRAPYILVAPFAAPFWITGAVGAPNPVSFSPLVFLGYSDQMTFVQRTVNLLGHALLSGVFKLYYNPLMEAIYQNHFGADKAGGVEEILGQVSLILSNGHFSLNFPRPMMPEVVDVGGMHCREAKPLPKDLDDFISAGKDGVIYFSMGSIIKGNEMLPKLRKTFLAVFSKLKQRVVWKWESDVMEGEPTLPPNIKLAKWLPQQDVLGHSNVKLFITHGGLLSTEEAVYHGVPLIGFPMFGDQEWNMANAKNLGFALSFDIMEVTEAELSSAINRIFTEPRFQEKANALSAIFRDRPIKPLDLAVYWTEYIIRHKGAVHLQSAARQLNAIQYHSIDVLIFLGLAAALVLYLVFAMFRFVVRKVCCRSKAKAGTESARIGAKNKKTN